MEKRLILNSWKEIADYMGRGVRTVQRYERDLRLPVHRPAGKSRSAVIAFADEIDVWMRKGPVLRVNGSPLKHVSTNLPEWQRLLANSELLLKRADILRTQMLELVRLLNETQRRRKLMQEATAPQPLSKLLHERTQTLREKMSEMSDLMAGGVETHDNKFLPAGERLANGQQGNLSKH